MPKPFCVFTAVFLCCTALAAQVSRFDIDTEKWEANIDAVGHIVHFDPSRGNPAPSIFADDSDTGQPWYFVAPDCFLGNRAYTYGDSLKYDLLIVQFSQTPYTNDIIIRSADGTTIVRNHGFNPTVNKWTHFAVRLVETDWHLNSGTGPSPTQAQFKQVLSSIASLEIRGEYRTGFDRAWLDNVWMGEVPDTTISATICQNEVFQVGDYKHFTSGTFLDELEDLNGCDSLLVTLHLTVKPAFSTLQKTGFCPGGSVVLPDGSVVSAAGFFPFEYTATNGCDSTVIVQVEAWPNQIANLKTSICQGETFNLPDGSATDQPGIYQFGLQTVHGCDSLLTIEISKHDTAWIGAAAVICGGEIFTMPDGSSATESGIYQFKFQTPHGCDSTMVVELEVTDSSLTINELDRCADEAVLLPDGTWADESGTHIFKYPNFLGCDSTLVFELRFHPRYDTVLVAVLPEGTPYLLPDGTTVRDTTLEKTYRFATPFGCDSVVTVRLDYIFYKVFIPNVFSPDDDGLNDFFTLFTNEDGREIRHLNIYDRWGDHVFERHHFVPNDERLGWDGTFRGKPVPPGVFAWWAEVEFVDGRVLWFEGDVTVVR